MKPIVPPAHYSIDRRDSDQVGDKGDDDDAAHAVVCVLLLGGFWSWVPER